MCHIDRLQHGRRIVRVNIADEFGVHEKLSVCCRPVLECDVNRTGTKVTAADTDLDNGRELLTFLIDDPAAVNLVCKVGDSLLLGDIELALVDVVLYNILSELAAAELMKDQAILARVNDFAVVKRFKLLGELCLTGKLYQNCEYVFVYCRCCVVEGKTLSHRDAVIQGTLSAALSAHDFGKIDRFRF